MQRPDKIATPYLSEHPNAKISVKNFGPIAEASIELNPLTVFVGRSNTGKTYFSTLIYALHRNFDGFSRMPLPNTFRTLMKSGYGSQSVFWEAFASSEEDAIDITHKLITSDGNFKFSDLPQSTRNMAQSSLKDSEFWEQNLGGELRRCFDLDSISEMILLTNGENNEMQVSVNVSEKTQDLWNFKMRTTQSGVFADGAFNENMVVFAKDGWNEEAISNAKKRAELCPELFPHPDLPPRACFYLPAARSGIMQSHRVIASSLVDTATRSGKFSLDVPTFSGLIADFMKRLILYKETNETGDSLANFADRLESKVLSGKVLMKLSSSGYPEFFYRPKATKQDIRMSRASSMVSELAPLVLFLREIIRIGDTLIIEEPEAHLHPGAQAEIALTLAGLVRAGVRVIVTTHSDWLLKEIANLIRIGELKEKGVSLPKTIGQTNWLLQGEVGTWWFQKDGLVKKIPFDSTEGIEPRDYEEVAYKLYDRSVNLQELLEEISGG